MGEILKNRLKQQTFESSLHEAILNLIVAAGYVRDHMEQVCNRYGITQSQYNVLRILKGAHPEGYPRCQISERMLERSPDVTRLIDRLEKQKLVQRDRSKEDKRLSITRITKKGMELLDSMRPEVERIFERFSARLGLQDSRKLSRICEQLYAPE